MKSIYLKRENCLQDASQKVGKNKEDLLQMNTQARTFAYNIISNKKQIVRMKNY